MPKMLADHALQNRHWVSIARMSFRPQKIGVLLTLPLLLWSMIGAAEVDRHTPFMILYHEPLIIYDVADTPADPDTAESSASRLRFDAFGRTFDVYLEKPARLQQWRLDPSYELLTGTIAGADSSWVRLTRRGDSLSGVLHDDVDTYVIEPRATVAAALGTTGSSTDATNIIYRLADTLVSPGLLSCSTASANHPGSAKIAFSTLASEIGATSAPTANTQTQTLEVGAIADIEFQKQFGANSAAELQSYFAIADGIFNAQLGLRVDLTETLIISSASQNPFSNVTAGPDLLDELADWRLNNQAYLDLTHLVTSRTLTGEDPNDRISGLSYLGSPGGFGVCDATTGSAISVSFGSLTGLIIAHEMAHNLGAPHDGVPSDDPLEPNPCESESLTGFLMGPTLTSANTDTFSQCSIQQMQPVIAAANCLSGSTPPTPTLPASSSAVDGGGGSGTGWISLAGLLIAWSSRRRVSA
jgi:hypothetical protein